MSSTNLEILVACIAAIPGLGGIWYSFRTRRDTREATATDFGTRMAQTAFQNMTTQVQRLTEEQQRYDIERSNWVRDKTILLAKISEMTEQLRVTNQYLQLLLGTLDQNGIAHPVPPVGYYPAP